MACQLLYAPNAKRGVSGDNKIEAYDEETTTNKSNTIFFVWFVTENKFGECMQKRHPQALWGRGREHDGDDDAREENDTTCALASAAGEGT